MYKALKQLLFGLSFFLFLITVMYYGESDFFLSKNEFNWPAGMAANHAQRQYSVMTANVGNGDLACKTYNWKLCRVEIEEKLAAHLEEIKPDIIGLQEVLPTWLCDAQQETNLQKVCAFKQDVPQVRRLLGDEYTIVCEPRSQYDCVAVSTKIGLIKDCELGGFCLNARTARVKEGCDPGFAIFAVTVELNDGTVFDLANMHPAARSDECRADMLTQAYLGDEPILINKQVILLGDFNFDPWRSNDQSSTVWNNFVQQGWAGAPLVYHSGIAESNPPRFTFSFFIRRSFDNILSNFAQGTGVIMGATPGTSRLDGGSGNDHRAVYAILQFP